MFKTCDISIVRELNIHIRIREGDENNYIYKFKELVLNKFDPQKARNCDICDICLTHDKSAYYHKSNVPPQTAVCSPPAMAAVAVRIMDQGSWVPKFPKRCVFGLKNPTFLAKNY